MSNIVTSQDAQGFIMALRHEGFDKKGYSLDRRGSMWGTKVFDEDYLGSWVRSEKDFFYGDINHAHFWDRKNEKARPMGQWSFAVPVILAPEGTSKNQFQTNLGGGGSSGPGSAQPAGSPAPNPNQQNSAGLAAHNQPGGPGGAPASAGPAPAPSGGGSGPGVIGVGAQGVSATVAGGASIVRDPASGNLVLRGANNVIGVGIGQSIPGTKYSIHRDSKGRLVMRGPNAGNIQIGVGARVGNGWVIERDQNGNLVMRRDAGGNPDVKLLQQGGCDHVATAAFPNFDGNTPDGRFATGVWGDGLPLGTKGIVLAGSDERTQHDIFHVTDDRLRAPNRFGKARETRVYDITKGGGYGVSAGIESFWYVARPIGGKPGYTSNVLAWQLGSAGCAGLVDGFGFVHERETNTLAVMGRLHSGPLHVGTPKGDKHFISDSADKEPTNSGHLSTESYFYRDTVRDAPLDFENVPYSSPPPAPYRVPAHIRYDNAVRHQHLDALKPGMWRVEAECYFRTPVPSPGCPPIPTVDESTPISTPTDESPAPSLASPLNKAYEPGMGVLPVGVANMDMGFTSVVGRPQAVVSPQDDLRRIRVPTDTQVCEFDKATPVTYRQEAFGDEGGWTVTTNSLGGGGGPAS
jgi:hypothetical protein